MSKKFSNFTQNEPIVSRVHSKSNVLEWTFVPKNAHKKVDSKPF